MLEVEMPRQRLNPRCTIILGEVAEMMTRAKIDMFVREFADKVGPAYPALVRKIVDDLSSRGFDVSIQDGIDQSTVETRDGGRFVRIGDVPGPDAFWDLVREHGHVLAGTATIPRDAPSREIETMAWDSGWKWAVTQDPLLASDKEAFERRRKQCIERTFGPGAAD